MKKDLLIAKVNYSLSFQKSIALLLLIIGVVFSAKAQVATGYTFSQLQSQTYVPITGGLPFVSGTAFTNTTPLIVNLGFTFNFNGTNYTDVYVTDNGFLVFTPAGGLGAQAPLAATPGPLSSPLTYPGAVSAFGYNLQAAATNGLYTLPGTSEVRYETITVGSQKVFVLQYSNVTRRSPIANQLGIINMQIRLYETTNVIETLYNTFNPSAYGQTALLVTASQQVGLRGATNADYNNRTIGTNADWSATAAGVANGNSMSLGGASLAVGAYNTTPTRFTWTPCFQTSGVAAVMQADNATATLTWNAATMPPVGGYDWEVRTSGNPGTGLGLFASGNTTATTVAVPGLQTGITYYIYVKANCKTSWLPVSVAPSSVTVTPVCSVATIPYSQTFQGVTIPAIPNCTTTINSGTTLVTVDRTVTPLGGFTTKNLVTTGALASNSWYFTQQIAFPSVGYYKLSYKYGGTSTSRTQKMKVAFGAVNTQAGMTTVIADHDNIKTSPETNTVNFYVPSAGNYYIGFNAYAIATQGSLQLDDINLNVTTCQFPTAMTSTSVGATTANISWTAPSPAPSAGYDYYISTSATPPINTTAPTGGTNSGILLASLTGLTSSTTYYFWARSNCGGGDISAWAATPGSFTTAFQAVLACTLTTPPTVTTTYINNIATTGGITNISNSSGLSANGYSDYTSLVVSNYQGQSVSFTTGISGPLVGVAVWVDWNNNGTFEPVERMAGTTSYVSTFSGSFIVPVTQANGDYRMRFLIDYWNNNPNNPCALVVNSTTRGEVEDYTFKVVSPPPALTLNLNSSAQCAGSNSPLVTITVGRIGTPASTVYQSFSWSPSTGVSGTAASGYTFNSTSTVTYTLTASQTVFPFNINTATFTYTANVAPTALVITPSSGILCGAAASAIQLVATGGIVAGTAALSENFNTGAPGWTTTSSSFGGTPASANWTIRNSGYNPGGSSGITSLVSNDNSQYYVSNSDSQGSGTTTDVQLISPTFSLAGYQDASLNFYHHVRPFNSAYSAKVEIFSGGTWTSLRTWVFSQGTQGTPTNFALVTINLDAYLGMSGLQIRFNYYDQWGYVWAVDNVVITGTSTPPTVSWTPNGVGSGLFTDPGASAIYSGGNATTLYAKPTVSQTYTATVTAPSGCTATATTTISSFPIAMGTASANQNISICSGAPLANISVSSYTGASLYWEYTDDAALLTGWTTIPLSNSITLTPAQIGSLTNTRYFRAVATNSTCTLQSSIVTVTVNSISIVTWNGSVWSNSNIGPDATLSAQFTGNYSSTGNLTACSVSVLSGTVLINAGHTLNVQKAVQVNTPGTLTFENSASLVQLDPPTDNGVTITNSGNITYKRDTSAILRMDYTYWSTPVSPQTIVGFTPLSPLAYSYNAAGPNWLFVPTSTTMSIAKGYTIRAPTSITAVSPPVITSVSFFGVPNTGNYSTPVISGSFNLIGNPYPSGLSANTFLNVANNPNLDGTIYLWTHNTPINLAYQYTGSDYALYNFSGGVGAGTATTSTYPGIAVGVVPNGFIAAGQGFMIKGLADGNAFFTNTMRASNNSQFFKNGIMNQTVTTTLEKNRVWLDITNSEGAFKQLLVGYIETATNALDRGFDGEMVDNGNVITFYTTVEDKKLSIQGKALPFDVNDSVPLGYKSLINGTFTIALSDFDGLFTTQNVYLEDTVTGEIHDLKNSSYSFATIIGTFENRFILRFTTAALGNPQFTANSVVVYHNDSGLHVTTGNVLMKNVTIYDVAGRLIASRNNIGASETVFANLPTTQQVLLVQITSDNGEKVTKKVVF